MQNLLFFLSFLFIIRNFFNTYFMGVSYSFGLDNFRYGIVLLSFWIISLIFLAREKIFKTNNFINIYIYSFIFIININNNIYKNKFI